MRSRVTITALLIVGCTPFGCSSTSANSGAQDAAATTPPQNTDSASDAPIMDDAGSPPDTDAASPEAAMGCPGVPITPDATGHVPVNSLGIKGNWFFYSDCTDLAGKNCAMTTAPTATTSYPNVHGKMCTSGTTSTAPGAWGAGMGFELNDGPPQHPYDLTAHGVKGFCFILSGATIPSTTIRVAVTTQNNQDNAYFEAVSTPGQQTVLFTDPGFAQGSWVKTPSPWDPTTAMLLQFQIPSDVKAPVPWDFCIEGLTAVTQ